MSNETYLGWTNRETWLINVWFNLESKEDVYSTRDLSSKELKEGFINWLSKNNPLDSFKVYWSKGQSNATN